MATQIKLPGTAPAPSTDHLTGGFAGAFLLHGAAAALLVGWAMYSHSGKSWGDSTSTNGAIQATMVTAIPLPQKQPLNADNVLATDAPSPAPVRPAPRTIEAPKPDAIPIPVKPTKPAPTAEKTAPAPPLHPQPTKPDLNKAQTGEAPGVKIAMSSIQTRLGTFSVGVTDTNFGTRFAYYNEQIKQKLEATWLIGMLDPQASGHRVYITFQVARDGSPSHVQIEQPSGDSTLDQTARSAVQHIETFGPLPDGYQGSYVNVHYYFEAPPHP